MTIGATTNAKIVRGEKTSTRGTTPLATAVNSRLNGGLIITKVDLENAPSTTTTNRVTATIAVAVSASVMSVSATSVLATKEDVVRYTTYAEIFRRERRAITTPLSIHGCVAAT